MKKLFIPTIAVLLTFIVAPSAFADVGPSKPLQAIDNPHRTSPTDKASDEYDRALLGDRTPDPEASGRTVEEMQQRLQKELGAAAQRESAPSEDETANPLLEVSRSMQDAGKRIGRGQADAVTQHLQRQIVADLEKLIDRARKSGNGKGGSNSQNSPSRKPSGSDAATKPKAGNPGQTPSEGAAKESNPNAPKAAEPKRGEALAKARFEIQELLLELPGDKHEQMLELPGEEFLPKYELQIEDYFRRLSEDKPEGGNPR